MFADSKAATTVSKKQRIFFDRLLVVLCRPTGSANIGAVCRAMASMGLWRLIITERSADYFDEAEVAKMAMHAMHIFNGAKFIGSLEDIYTDTVQLVGITRRRGSKRKYFSLVPEQLVAQFQKISTGKLALVFGTERTGLSDKELSYCHLACHIPTDEACPSLNLAQAVQIISYHFFRVGTISSGFTPIDTQELQRLSNKILGDLRAIGLIDKLNNQRTDVFLKDILARASLSPREAQRLQRIFTTIRSANTKRSN